MSEEFEVNKNTFVRIGNTHEITMVSKTEERVLFCNIL